MLREYWENKGITLWLPLVLAALLVAQNVLGLGVLFINGGIDHVVEVIDHSKQLSQMDGAERSGEITFHDRGWKLNNKEDSSYFLRLSDAQFAMSSGLHVISVVFMVVAALISGFYLLQCLYSDRNDRSVLFWKSLPVDEVANVLSKLLYGILVIPLVVFIFAVIAEVSGSLTLALIYSASENYSFWGMLGEINPISMVLRQLLSILMFAFNGLPIAAWLLFCSAFSRRLPIVMALIVPFVISVLEHFLLGDKYIGAFLEYVFDTGHPVLEGVWRGESFSTLLAYYDGVQVVTSICFSMVLLAGAVWCRNNRFEI